ncbi:hypothetical protein AB4Z21_03340 [Paenibacillus sp. MCAF20]
MFGLLLFLHLAGLALWIGSLVTILVVLPLVRKNVSTVEANILIGKITRAFSWISHPSALFVLVSGVLMLIQMELGSDKPLWLDVMEKGGGTIVLLSLILTGIFGGKLRKRINLAVTASGATQASASQAVNLSSYLTLSAIIAAAVIAVLLIVSLKL